MALVKSDASPKGRTHYFDIDLGLGDERRLTAVFFPAAFAPTDSVDAIVFLHGVRAPVVDQLLQLQSFRLQEETSEADPAKLANLVLVVPTLGLSCEAGALVDRGLDWYLREVLGSIAGASLDLGGSSAAQGFDKVYVAAHSGGGRPARALAVKRSAVTEYWLFDALYAPAGYPATDKTNPANARPLGHPDAVEDEWLHVLETQRVTLHDYYLTHEPTRRSKNLEHLVRTRTAPLLGRATFVRSHARSHDEVPVTHWKDLVNGRG